MNLNIEKFDDIQLSLILAHKYSKDKAVPQITRDADRYYEWLQKKRNGSSEEKVNNLKFRTSGVLHGTTNHTLLAHNFEPDGTSAKNTKCKICGLENWRHPVLSYT